MPFHPDDGTPFFQLARTVIQQANFACSIHIAEPDRIVSHYDRVMRLLEVFLRLSAGDHGEAITDWIDTIIRTQSRITQYLESIGEYDYELVDNDATIPYAVVPEFPQVHTGGRPQISLPWTTITVYRNSNYSWTQIASLLNIHPRTLHRYRIRYDYQDPKPYSAITDEALDHMVSTTINQTSGVIGSQFMYAILLDN